VRSWLADADLAYPLHMRLLIIEDDAETATHLTKGLQESGYSVEHAATGPAGRETRAKLRPMMRSSWTACCRAWTV